VGVGSGALRVLPFLVAVALSSSGSSGACGACGRSRSSVPSDDSEASAGRASELAALRVSMIPSTDPGKLLRESEPLVGFLKNKTGRDVTFTVPTNYASVVEALANDQVDIAYLGGFTYVQASRRAGVVPLVQRDRDQRFHSLFITSAQSAIVGLADLKGHSFAFGDVNSTSGHLMPEYFMRRAGVDPAVIAKATYTGGHDATALAVANGRIDAGALDEAVFERMTKEGKIDASKVRVFFTTPPFFDYVWAARKGLDHGVREAFTAAFLGLSSQDAPLLDVLQAKAYVRADDRSYDPLRQAATEAGLLR
jgi:phosphonate transport system substrate-binding protein